MARKSGLKESVPGLLDVLRFFWPWIRKERPLITGSLMALLAGVILRLAEPWPLKFILDRVIPTDRLPGLNTIPALDDLDPMTLLTVTTVALVIITSVRALFDSMHKVGFAKVGNRVLREIRTHVFHHMQSLSLAFHDKSRSGDLIIRVTRDVSLLRDVTSTAILPLVASVLILTGMVAVMLLLQWQLALLAMTVVPLFWFSTSRIGKGIHQAARKQRKREGAMAATAAESITAIREIQALALEDVFAESFASSNVKSQKQDMKAAKLSASLVRTVDILLAISTSMVMWYGAVLVTRGSITPGDLIIFLAYLKRAFKPAKDFAKYTARLAKATAAGERVLALLERTPDVQDLPDAVEAPPFQGRVSFENVTFAYEAEHPVFSGVDFQLARGEMVAIVGESGIGKSTLASLLLRLYDPVEGRVKIDDRDIREFKLPSLRNQISVVLQDALLFASTVGENIAHGATDPSQEMIEEAARLASAHEFILDLPQGYDTPVGERGTTLSRGQRQRISIARSAMQRSPILILDEPTAGLDETNEREIVETLLRMARERTTLLITHNMRLAANADLVIYLDRSGIIERGPPADLIRQGGRYASVYKLQCSQENVHGR